MKRIGRLVVAILAVVMLNAAAGVAAPGSAGGDRPRINLNKILNPYHTDIFRSEDPELWVYGGAGAGKSYSIADKILLKSILNPGRQKGVLVRKTLASLRKTTLDILERRAEALGLDLIIDRQNWIARVGNLSIILTGMNNKDDHQKIKSLTDVDFVWVNELTELREDDYRELLLRIRGGESKLRRQMIADFNPIGKTSWIYDRGWARGLERTAKKLRYTVLDNPWAQAEYIEHLKSTASDDPNFYNIYFLGEWGELKGIIFYWDVVDELPAIGFDEIIYGGDFGYSVDPAAVVRIYRRADEYWLEELIYSTGLTNRDLARAALAAGVPAKSENFWDSAEPKSIDELRLEGLRGAKPATKGPGSVKFGIDFLLSKKIHILGNSPNLIKEVRSYVRKKDKDGRSLPEPMEYNDHAIKAVVYGIVSAAHKGGRAFVGQSGGEVY